MHKIWQRFLASPLRDNWAWWVSAVLGVFVLGWLYAALSNSVYRVQVPAILALLGLQLAALNVVVALFGAVRASAAGDDDVSLRKMLAGRVHRQECEARTALLGGVVVADLVFDDLDPRSDSPPGRLHKPVLGSGNGKRGRNGTLWRFSLSVMRLLSWKGTSFSLLSPCGEDGGHGRFGPAERGRAV
ncbi:hypothetical protein ACSDR0_01295 [Streptosporangium sp. G11]|uniref:hypothetical protein n=1 Tax=Streptosporangium sp. G11 TaxID=3436926 RepID=UPI003EBBFD70